MIIKKVNPKDRDLIKGILELEKECFGVDGAVDIWNLMPIIRYGSVYVGVDENENLLGVVEYQGSIEEKKAYLYGLCVGGKHQGKGVGYTLLKESMKELSKRNIDEITLTVDESNKGAIRIYKKIGYEKIDYLVDEYGSGKDRVLMKWKNI